MLRAPAMSVCMVGLFLGLLAMIAVTVAFPGSAGAQTSSTVAIPVTGKLSDGGTFKGKVFNPDVSYHSASDSLKISGVLRGTATKANGATETVRKEFTTGLKVTQGTDTRAPSCRILELDIGRINLDLLGFVVNIAPISIDITAVPGAGNLLRSEEHTSELQSRQYLVCRLLLEKKQLSRPPPR